MAAALSAAGCGDASSSDADRKQVEAADTALNKALDRKDSKAIAALYATDAVLLPTAEPAVIGQEAIAEEWAHIVAIPGFANTNERLGTDVSGDLAYTWGKYEAALTLEDGSAGSEPGKWLTVWRRQPDGRWLIVADTYNTDIPPPDHK